MSKKKKRASSQRKNEITKGIFTVLEKEPSKTFNYKQIASKLGITDTQDRNLLIQRLGQLRASDRIVEPERGRHEDAQRVDRDAEHHHVRHDGEERVEVRRPR